MPALLFVATSQYLLQRKHDYRAVVKQWTPSSDSTIAAFKRHVTIHVIDKVINILENNEIDGHITPGHNIFHTTYLLKVGEV
jgi:hypothetical protein